jgi:two-component system chemotaxis response regulator CheY
MQILIVEDDIPSRILLTRMLEPFGTCVGVGNGKEALQAFRLANATGERYALVCLDIMMPEMDGQTTLKELREIERADGLLPRQCAKIVMTTALRDIENVTMAYRELCDGYLVKPILREKLVALLKELELVTLREEHLTA